MGSPEYWPRMSLTQIVNGSDSSIKAMLELNTAIIKLQHEFVPG